ncbi:MAG: GNAT family N-acetyltransferase [Patescibacteria group bacterium]
MLIGEKVELRQWQKETDFDFGRILGWIIDPEVMKFVGFYKKTCDFKTGLEVKQFFKKLEDSIFWGIYLIDSDIPIGWTSLSHFTGDACEFGIFICEKKYWGKGIGTEVTKILSDYALNNMNMKQVVLTTCDLNIGGIKAYQRAGFVVQSIDQGARTVFIDGKWQSAGTVKMAKTKPVSGRA